MALNESLPNEVVRGIMKNIPDELLNISYVRDLTTKVFAKNISAFY